MLDKLPTVSGAASSAKYKPSHLIDLDFSLLKSSPPDGIKLRQANPQLNSAIRASCDLPSPAKRYTERMSRAFESNHSENVTLRKQLKEAEELLGTRKIRKKGKRFALKGRYVFTTEEVLKVVEGAEAETAKKQTRKQPKQDKIENTIEIGDDEILEEPSGGSDSDCMLLLSVND